MKLKIYRKLNKLTLKDLASQVSCTPAMISYIECGQRRPSADLALKIEKVCGGKVTRDQLLYPFLYERLDDLESQIKPEFDADLSRKIDRTTLIIETSGI